MAIPVHVVNTTKSDARGAYEAAWPGRAGPGSAAASASSAPCLAVRHRCTTTERRSTPYRCAASSCVASPVSPTMTANCAIADRLRKEVLPPPGW